MIYNHVLHYDMGFTYTQYYHCTVFMDSIMLVARIGGTPVAWTSCRYR